MSQKNSQRPARRLNFIWRLLCLLTLMSVLLVMSGAFWRLPEFWQGLAVTPGLLVMLVIVVSWCADFTDSSTSHDASGAR